MRDTTLVAKRGRPGVLQQHIEAGERLKLRRCQLGMSISQVADKLGVNYAKYRHLEVQFTQTAQDQYIGALSIILNVTPEWIEKGVAEGPQHDGIIPVRAKPRDAEMRKALGRRALRRRQAISMTRQELAKILEVDTAAVGNAEQQLPINLQGDKAKAWEEALGVPSGWLFDPGMEAPKLPSRDETPAQEKLRIPNEAATVTDEIKAVAAWLSRKALTRRTTDYGELTQSERAKADIFAARYGILGEDVCTLETVGQSVGLTRERVRQIVRDMTDRSDTLTIATPLLDSLKPQVDALAPATIDEIDQRLRPILGPKLSVRSAQRFSTEVMAKNVAVMTRSPWNQLSSKANLVLSTQSDRDTDFMRAVRSCAMKMIRFSGAAHIHFVAGAVSEEAGRQVSAKEVRTACSLVRGFEWLIQTDDWFWFGASSENRLLTVTNKILATVNDRVDIEDIYVAMGKSQRMHYSVEDAARPYLIDAPLAVINQVLSKTSWIKTIQKNDFALRVPINVEQVLSDVELNILKVIKANNGVASKYDIDQALGKALTVTPIAIAMALARSPILMQPGFGLYAIRGVGINPRALESAIQRVGGPDKPSNNVVRMSDEPGWYHWEFEFTQYQQQNKIISIPIAIGRELTGGEYQVADWNQNIRLADRGGNKGKNFRRLAAALIRNGASVGSLVHLKIHPVDRKIQVTIENRDPPKGD